MQKKSVLLLTAGGVIRCADVVSQPMRDSQLLHLSRLLLLLEYLMKHLYDAPPALLEQVIRLQIILVLRVTDFLE
jgi:E3 ubiquitin-protein ligase UBR4